VDIPVVDPAGLPAEMWRTPAALRMLRTRDFRSILHLAQLHGLSPESVATRAGLAAGLVLRAMSGDAALAEPDQIEALACALDMPLAARSALGLAPRPRDPLAMPAEFWERPYVAHALVGWDIPTVLRAVMSERHWTQQQLAGVLGYSQSWVSNVMRGTQSLTLDQARLIAGKFGAPFGRLTMKVSGRSGQQPGGTRRALEVSGAASASDATEGRAQQLIEWVASTNISDDVIGYLTKAGATAAEDHVSLPPAIMLPKVQQLHATIATLLQGGRQRLRQTRDLLRLDAELLAHLCQLLGDVRRDRAASACGQAAIALAGEADCSPAAAYSAQAQIARWRGRHVEAADLAAEGFRRGAPPPLFTLLAYQEATAAAAAGDGRRAHAAIARAEAAGDGPAAPVSVWSCPPGRQALYRLGIELSLGRPREALKLAADAKTLWQSELPHAFGTWAHFQIAVANAHLMLGSVDGAAEQVTPVLNLRAEYRLATLAEHLATTDLLLRQGPYSGLASAAAIRERIEEFRAHGASPVNAKEDA
jgi:transcriptional regulator with XRE-family HTH domain